MNRLMICPAVQLGSIPRASGDEPLMEGFAMSESPYSPRERG